jgi:transposase
MAVFKGLAEDPEEEKSLSGDLTKLLKAVLPYKKLGKVQVAYEAGCMGFTIYHKLREHGLDCRVIPPNKVFRPGNRTRIKNDKTDAVLIANMLQYQKGESIHVPTRDDEATRDLLRCRTDILDNQRRTKQQLLKFCLRHDRDYTDGNNWTEKHFKWLTEQKFDMKNEQLAFDQYVTFIEDMNDRLKRVDDEVEQIATSELYIKEVQKLRAFKGIDYIIALSFICEISDFTRFPTAQRFMSYLGLVPSESSSGDKVSRGGITKTGNSHMRSLVIEAAWHYAPTPVYSKRLARKRAGTDEKIIAVADKAIYRLHKKYMRLTMRRKPSNVAITAVARELCGFIWNVMKGEAV